MAFNKSTMWYIGVGLIVTVITAFAFMKGNQQQMDPSGQGSATNQGLDIPFNLPHGLQKPESTITRPDDDDGAFKQMAEEMQEYRQEEKRIKSLQMQREETDLELAEQKELAELSKIKRDNLGNVTEISPDGSGLNIKLVYVGGTEDQKEAILSINGTDFSVKDQDRPLNNLQVLAITDNSVTIHLLGPKGSINTYSFKPE